MPAERAMGFLIERLSKAVDVARRSRVSETVEEEDCESRSIRASIAATGIVRSGSEARRDL